LLTGSIAEPRMQSAGVDRAQLLSTLTVGFENAGGGEQSGLDRGTDSLTALAVCQTDRIANQEHSRLRCGTRESRSQAIGVAVKPVGQIEGDFAARPQEFDELRDVCRQMLFPRTAQSDVEIVSLPKHPAVSRQI